MTTQRRTSTRILLADDEPLVRAGLAMLLEAEDGLAVVGEASDGIQTVQRAMQLRPDVIVMDVRMPGMDGVEATRRLAEDAFVDKVGSTAAVLILTTFNDDEAVYAALRAGASGFMLKNAAPKDLAAAVRAVAAGDAWLHPAVARKLLTDFTDRPDPDLPTPKEMQRLTPREKEVLVLVAHGLTNHAIAEHLVLSNATVRTHLGRILVKLGLHDRAQAVAAAYRCGLLLPGDDPPPQSGKP
ncbi:response regulator [Streptomyces minutiscleroticus]|uniref:DNA-binding response regulator n=1 Tax=Streptomyces minutiscleroticus TaxID=68238 RepID=A0A918P4L1_9ACTN|nr:response regulator transcription factor [Streptomyces minutiscleroticus]GGY19440.1 DNA-binding response regulator [Streptomyces minutiscleroticus]